jgi:hypothetical protein
MHALELDALLVSSQKQKLNKERRKINYSYIYYQKKLNKFESQKPASL